MTDQQVVILCRKLLETPLAIMWTMVLVLGIGESGKPLPQWPKQHGYYFSRMKQVDVFPSASDSNTVRLRGKRGQPRRVLEHFSRMEN